MTKSLTELFNDEKQGEYVPSSVLEAAKLKQTDEDYSKVEGGAESIGRTPLAHSKPDETNPNSSKSKEKYFTELLHRLQEQQHWIKAQMKLVKQEIDGLTEKIDLHAQNLDALDEFLEHYRITGEFDLAEDGYPKDELVRQLITTHEQETGIIWDANSPNAFGFIRGIEEQERSNITELSYQREEKFKEWNTLQEAYDHTTENIDKLGEGEYISETELEMWSTVKDVTEPIQKTSSEYQETTVNLDALPSLKM